MNETVGLKVASAMKWLRALLEILVTLVSKLTNLFFVFFIIPYLKKKLAQKIVVYP